MRLKRNRSRYLFRRTRRRSGCLPFLLFGLMAGVLVMSWGWLGQRFQRTDAPPVQGSLTAAQQAFDSGRLDTAVEESRRVLEREPTRTDALILLARALVYRSYTDYNRNIDRQVALAVTAGALARMPNNPDVLAIHAFTLQANGEHVTAFRTAERALRLDPENTIARMALGLAYGGVGSFDNAFREIQRAAQSPFWRMDTQRALAVAYSDLGRYREAGDTADRALTYNDNIPALHFERALYAIQIGDTSRATTAYFAILTHDPQNVKVRLRMCELSSLLRETDSALRYCAEVTERAPNWADGWYRLGREYFLQGDFTNAQAYLNRCSTLQVSQNVAISERQFECWYLQGQAAEMNGDCPALVATYNEFQAMAAQASIPQTWTYPPEGPPGC